MRLLEEIFVIQHTDQNANRKVKITIKYFLTSLPANINPSCDVLAIDINKYILRKRWGGGAYKCDPCQSDMGWRGKFGIHGGGKIHGA